MLWIIILFILIVAPTGIVIRNSNSNSDKTIDKNIDTNKLCVSIKNIEESTTEFEKAVLSGILQDVVKVNRSMVISQTEFVRALSCAVAISNKEIVSWMLSVRPELKHELLQYGFITATCDGNVGMVENIISHDKDMYVRNNWYSVGLHYALHSRSKEIVKYMVKRNYNRCFTVRDDVVTLCRKGDFESAKILYKVYKKNHRKDKYLEDAIRTKNDSFL